MLYLANPCGPETVQAMVDGRLGCILTPKQGNVVPAGITYVCDNGRYGKGWPGAWAWCTWLARTVSTYGPTKCLFATAPDRVGDPYGTLADSLPWLPVIRQFGVPAAFVAQDGCERGLVPWGHFDVLFLGGSTKWKLSPSVARLAGEAVARGIPVHMGRVNSFKRVDYARAIGCSTVDGTFLIFGPRVNLPRLLGWVDRMDQAPMLV